MVDGRLRKEIVSNLIGCYRWVADEIDKGNERLKESLQKAASGGDYVWLGCYDGEMEKLDAGTIGVRDFVPADEISKERRACYYVSASPGFSFKTGDYLACEAVADIDGDGRLEHWRKYAIYYGRCSCFKPLEACMSEEKDNESILDDLLKDGRLHGRTSRGSIGGGEE
ncbi:MAG: hypothetical protein D6806_16090 [Deltaproteobacteria bacterium]|nr:MAG: hypothetical protein D6806_16090 [Deltaproteobacteria bacterium]